MGFWFWAFLFALLLTDLRYEIVNLLSGMDAVALVALVLLVIYMADR